VLSNTGVVVCGQKVALGRFHRHQTLKIHVAETTLAIELEDGETGSCGARPPPRA
jgi:hypothetical protein